MVKNMFSFLGEFMDSQCQNKMVQTRFCGEWMNEETRRQIVFIWEVDGDIPDGFFNGCPNLKQVNLLSETTKRIGKGAFAHCPSLTTLAWLREGLVEIDDQGQQYHWLFIDEATQFLETEFRGLDAIVRSADKIPKRIYLTCNPGGPGHTWVKRLFVDRKFKKGEDPADYVFIPATVDDNKDLILLLILGIRGGIITMLLWFGGSYWGSVGNVLVTLSFSRWVLVTPAGIFYFLSIAFCNSSRITADLFSALVRSSYNSGSWLRLIRRLTHTVFSAFHLACDLGSDIDFHRFLCYI